MDRKQERDALHGPSPTRPEELSARYADRWIIYRELHDGTHGDWVAEARDLVADPHERITARDTDSLAEKLAEAGS